tara:strand:- start:163 stop:810 length:648 start_codon:yes stop_codon:yes gene_type:complete
MRMVGRPPNLILLKPHLENLIKSTKNYGIRKKNLKNILLDLIKKNTSFKGSDNLFRIALNKKIISVSIRKRPIPKKDFNLLLFKYKRIDPKYKNLYYKKIITKLSKLDPTKFDIALVSNNKILETGTSNLVFVKNGKVYCPKKNCYFGNTIKHINKKIKIIRKDISINKIQNFDEILLIGSGKGITSVSKIDELNWKRKKIVCYRKINKIYNSLI